MLSGLWQTGQQRIVCCAPVLVVCCTVGGQLNITGAYLNYNWLAPAWVDRNALPNLPSLTGIRTPEHTYSL